MAIGAIAAFALVHIAGVKFGMRLITPVTRAQDRPGPWAHARGAGERSWILVTFRAVRGSPAGAPPLFGALAGAFVSAFFSFGGWWEVTKIAGEVRIRLARFRGH